MRRLYLFLIISAGAGLVFFPAAGQAAIPLTYVEQGGYETMGKIIYSKQFGKDMLEVNGAVQMTARVSASTFVTTYDGTRKCAGYVARAFHLDDDGISRPFSTVFDNLSPDQKSFQVLHPKGVLVSPRASEVEITFGYQDQEGRSYKLTPQITEKGPRDWLQELCLEPDQDYTLAIFVFQERPEVQKHLGVPALTYRLFFTDFIPDQTPDPVKLTKVPAPGKSPPLPPPPSWPETPRQIMVVGGFIVFLVAIFAVRFWRRRFRK